MQRRGDITNVLDGSDLSEPAEEVKQEPFQGCVLLMDDQELVLEVAGEMLEEMGLNVRLAKDGRQAVQIYREGMESGDRIDLVIMDLHIPNGMGGKEAVKELLALDPEAKVLVSSGSGEDPAVSSFSKFGFKGMIIKPYTYLQLRQAVQDAILQPSSE
jgi:CheY-like chemotaxis protein